MTDHVKVSDGSGIRTIRLCRADKKNAITQAMYSAMVEAIEGAQETDISALVILGQPGVFSAGNDIQDFMMSAMASDIAASPTMQFLRALATNKKPLVAGVDGMAIGVGATLLMHCDMVFATPRTSIKTPFLNLGLVPEAGSSLIAPRVMGHAKAFELLIMGEAFSAEAAERTGLVNHIVAEDALEMSVHTAACKLAALAPEALRQSRALLKGESDEIVARINEEAALFAERLKSDEAREAFTAFLEKREPNFKAAG